MNDDGDDEDYDDEDYDEDEMFNEYKVKSMQDCIDNHAYKLFSSDQGGVCSFAYLVKPDKKSDDLLFQVMSNAPCHASASAYNKNNPDYSFGGELVGFATSLWIDYSLAKEKEHVHLWYDMLLDPKVSPWRSVLGNTHVVWDKDKRHGALFFDGMKGRKAKTFFNLLVASRLPTEWESHISFFDLMLKRGMDKYTAFILSFKFQYMMYDNKVRMDNNLSWHYPLNRELDMDWDIFIKGAPNDLSGDYCDGHATHPNNMIWDSKVPNRSTTLGFFINPLGEEVIENKKYAGPFQAQYNKKEVAKKIGGGSLSIDQAASLLRLPCAT